MLKGTLPSRSQDAFQSVTVASRSYHFPLYIHTCSRRCEPTVTYFCYEVGLNHVLVMPYIDVTASLNAEAKTRGGKWLQTSPVTKVFRRHLENILSVQTVSVPSKRTNKVAVAILRHSLVYNTCYPSSILYELAKCALSGKS